MLYNDANINVCKWCNIINIARECKKTNYRKNINGRCNVYARLTPPPHSDSES